MARWLRRLLLTVAGAAAVVVLLGGASVLLFQTSAAKRLLTERLETELASSTGFGVKIGGIDGFLPFSATIDDIRLSDIRGTWLTADRLELDWRPAALLAGRLQVRRIVAGDIALTHAPAATHLPDDAQPGLDLAIGLPRLPLPITIDVLRIERLALAREVLGTAAVLKAAGHASLGGRARDAALALTIGRIDGGAGHASLQLSQSGSPAVLTLAAEIDEPGGGLIARALSLPGLPPVSLRLAGDGPATGWRGKLGAAAGPTRLDADVTMSLGDTLALGVDGRAHDAGRLAPDVAAFVPPSLDVATRLRWQPGRRLDIERLSLAAPDAKLDLSGTLDLAGDRIQASVEVVVADAMRWRPLLAPAGIGTAHLSGNVAGSLDEPAFELQAAIDELSAPDFAAERVEAKFRGRATLQDQHVVTAVALTGEGESSGMVIGIDPQLAALAGETATWSVRADLDLLSGDIEIDQARILAGRSTLEANGSIGGYGRAVDATVRADLADIVPVAELLGLPASGIASLTAELSGDPLAPRLTADISGRLADLVVDEPTVAALLGPAPTIAGTIAANTDQVEIGTLAIDGAGTSATIRGSMAMDASALSLNAVATVDDVAPLAASLGIAARGRLASRLQLARTPDQPALRFDGTVDAEDLVVDEATTALLGPMVHARAEGSFGPAGVELASAHVEGGAAQLAASGRIGDALALHYRLSLPRLAALSPLAGIDLAGAAAAAGDVSGPAASPVVTGEFTAERLRIGGASVASAAGNVSARDLGNQPQGELALDIVTEGRHLSLGASYQMKADGSVAFGGLRLAGPHTSLAGDLVLSPAGLLEGRVGGEIGDLALVGSLFGETIDGAGTLDLAFAPEQGQAVDATLELRNLTLAMIEGAPLSAEQLTLTADLTNAFAMPGGRAELRIGNAARGETRLAQAALAVNGNARAMAIRLTATGEHERPLAIDAAGRLTLDGATQRLRLNRLDASFDAIEGKLNAPVMLSHDSAGIAIAELDAAIGAGRLTGAGRLGASQVDVHLSLADLPLDLVAVFAPHLDVGGAVSADLDLAGRAAAPSAHADIRLAGLRVGGTQIGETVGIDGTVTLDVRDGRGRLTAQLGGPPDFAIDGEMAAPLAFGLQPFAFELAAAAPVAGTVDGRIDLALVPRIVDLHGDTLGGGLDIDMTIDGTLAAPRLVGEARIFAGSYATAEAGTVLRDVTAVVTGDNDRIVLRSLTAVDGGGGRLSARGSAALGAVDDARYDVEITLTQFAIPGDGAATIASGHVAGNAEIAGADADGRRRFVASVDANDLAIDGRNAGVFGPQMQANLEGSFDDSDILIESARVQGADGEFAASGQIGESIEMEYRLDLHRLAGLSPLVGIDLGGSASATGEVTGPARSPRITAGLSGRALRVVGTVFDDVSGTVIARDLGGSPEGEIDLAATAQGRRLSLATPYRLREDGAIALTDLRLIAPRTSLTGSLAAMPAGLLDGRIRGELGDLALFSPFVGQPMAGAATLDLSFAPSNGKQSVRTDIEMRDLSLISADGAPVSAERVILQANLDDVLGTPGGRAELRIENAASGALSLTRATFAADGAGTTMQVRLDASGEHGRPFDIAAAGELALAPAAQRLRLDRLDGNFGPIDAKLNAPATLSRDGRTMALAGLDASIGEGRITGNGNLSSRDVALQLAVADLPLDIVAAFAPQVVIDGTVSADLRVAGTAAAPTAHAEVRLTGLRNGGTKIGDGVALDGTATFDLRDGRGAMTARLGGPGDVALDGRLTFPVAFGVRPFALDVVPGAPLSGTVAGTVDLGLVPQIVDLYGDAMDGRFDLDMTIAGTPSAPRLIGTAGIADGSYASAEAGTVLRNIEARLSGDNERILLQSLTATDGGQGRLSATGSAILGTGNARYDGELVLQRFTILNRSDALATASGRLQLENAGQAARLGGEMTIDSAELRIPESIPPEIVKIDVIEVNVPPERAAAARPGPTGASMAPPLGLAVKVNIPGRAFLRGRGVDTEWRGDLRVAGTMAAPNITGRLEVVRGGIDLLGTPFEVESGTVTFVGGDEIDPELDFTAGAEANDVDARVRVTGFVSAPKFEIGSDSGLPPEEAMSRLLFGQSAGSLSPAQAVQLAQAAAALGGGGPGVLDKLRRGIGLDVLSLETTGPAAEDTSVKAGKYISDKVFLKVEQGVTQESREVGVEVRVLPNVTVEGGVGHEGSGRVGVNWRYDY